MIAIVTSACMAASTAWGWEKSVTIDYALGDADSRITAREAAYEALKVEAARSAKTYVQTTQTLKNNELSESIEVLGASMIELHGVQEAFDGGKARNGMLTVTGTAVIDESELRARVEQLQGNRQKAGSMKALTAENRKLRQRLESLRLDLQSKRISAKQIPEVMEQQNKAREDLEAVTRKINNVFEQGTLLEIASMSGREVEDIKENLKTTVIDAIRLENYQASIIDVKKDGGKVHVMVDLDWRLPSKELEAPLDEHLRLQSSWNYIKIESYENTNGKGPSRHSEAIMGWLKDQEIVAKVRVGGVSRVIPIMYVKRSFHDDCDSRPSSAGSDVGDRTFELCILKAPSGRIYGNDRNPMPIKITMLESQAASATGVDVSVIWRKPTPKALGQGS